MGHTHTEGRGLDDGGGAEVRGEEVLLREVEEHGRHVVRPGLVGASDQWAAERMLEDGCKNVFAPGIVWM